MKKWSFTLLVILLYAMTPYFFLSALDAGVSLQYEVFEPKESYYYSTLKSAEEKEKYIAEVKGNNVRIERRSLINRSLMLFSFITATGLLVFRRRIIKSSAWVTKQ